MLQIDISISNRCISIGIKVQTDVNVSNRCKCLSKILSNKQKPTLYYLLINRNNWLANQLEPFELQAFRAGSCGTLEF